MKTTVNLNQDLVQRAMKLTNIESVTDLVHAGLEALVAESSRKRLIELGGKDKGAKAPARRPES